MTSVLAEAIREGLAAQARPDKAAAMQRYMKTDMPFLGVPAPTTAAVLREALAHHPVAGRAELERTVRLLFEEATYREEWYAATGLLRRPAHARLLTPDSVELIAWIALRGAWWDVVDSLVRPLRTLLVAYRPRVELEIRTWIGGDELWLRRLTLICQLGRRERTDVTLLSDAIEAAQHDPEFFLRKGIGWALRDYSKTDADWVRAFVEAHPTLSPLSRREALRWLARREARDAPRHAGRRGR